MPIIVKTIAHFLLFSPNLPSKFNRINFCDCILVSKSSELTIKLEKIYYEVMCAVNEAINSSDVM